MSQSIEVPIRGMDCVECTQHVQRAIAKIPGVATVDVFLASEKASIRFEQGQADLAGRMAAIRKAVQEAGYSVPEGEMSEPKVTTLAAGFSRRILTLLGIIFGLLLFVSVLGEGLGLFETITDHIPWPISLAFIILAGYPVFRNVLRAAFHRQIISHTLMTLGVLAAIAVGEWATAAVVVVFMRVGDYAERFTTERSRHAVKNLTALTPQKARLEREGLELEVPVQEVRVGEVVIVRPGEEIPVDGEVVSGQATIDQSTITGESLPVEAGPGSIVYAATITQVGSIRIRTTRVGTDTTFGRVVKLVEEAEMHKADVQRVADKFSAYYLPVVAGIAVLTLLFRRDPLATAAVLVVACSCSFVLATPIAMLASIGASARHGLLIKGGKYLETLDKADVLLIDKTGTLTLGQPQITDIIVANSERRLAGEAGLSANPDLPDAPHESQLTALQLAASAERYSEHPLAEAIRRAAKGYHLTLHEPQDFENMPGMGMRARVNGSMVTIGNWSMMTSIIRPLENPVLAENQNKLFDLARKLEEQGKTVIFILEDQVLVGLMAAADTLRPEVPEAIALVRQFGIQHVELLTGDNERTTIGLIEGEGNSPLKGIRYRANLLPEDKIAIVKEYQSQGHTVVMVGDGINDAPALAQADVGIAMGAAGADIAVEAAHIALLRDDWRLVPEALKIARRTMKVVKFNIAFTTVYNILGISLAALGYLPPILAAAAQSLPDFGILANSSRLLRQK